MNIKFKKLIDSAVIPGKSHPGDAGLDLVATSFEINNKFNFIEYGTGLAMEIPTHCVALIFPRSSVSKTNHSLRNCVGVIDSSYRGEIKLRFSLDNSENKGYDISDKIGQIIVFELPELEVVETKELSDTSRGGGGFGSTGK